jgi:hypothetical protein
LELLNAAEGCGFGVCIEILESLDDRESGRLCCELRRRDRRKGLRNFRFREVIWAIAARVQYVSA